MTMTCISDWHEGAQVSTIMQYATSEYAVPTPGSLINGFCSIDSGRNSGDRDQQYSCSVLCNVIVFVKMSKMLV